MLLIVFNLFEIFRFKIFVQRVFVEMFKRNGQIYCFRIKLKCFIFTAEYEKVNELYLNVPN